MKYISVFSGIEAATVAWRPLGWEAIAFSEIEPFPCQVLKHHYPDVPNLGDISKVDWRQFLGAVDLVVGGSPCQSFSVAGSRTGLDGASGLVREYFRLLSECKPRWFLWENVPGVVSSNGGLDWIFILREWHKLGYNVSFRVLDAQYAGVPQRRRRIFAVGYLGDWRPPAKVLFESYSLQRHPAPSREKRKNHTEGSEVCSYKAGGFGEWNEGIGTCRASRQGDETLVAKTLTAKNGYRLNAQDENLLVAKCLTSKNQRNDMETETLVYSIAGNTIDRQLQNGGNGAGFQEDISYTLNTVDRHAVAECYSFDSLASNSMKSSNPDSGCRKVDVAKTLDTSNGDPSKNQGGIAVCYPIDLRALGKTKKENMPVGEEGSPAYTLTKSFTHGVAFCSDVSPTISASGPPFSRPGNEYVETEALVVEPSVTPPITTKWAREGWTAYDETAPLVSSTFQDTADCLTAAYGTKWNGNASADNGSLFAMSQPPLMLKDREGKPGGGKGLLIGKDQSFTLSCNQDQSMFHHAAVRRLTPLEAERLQGFPEVIYLETEAMNRDDAVAFALLNKDIRVDATTGKIFRMRGPGGHRLDSPAEIPCSNLNGYKVFSLHAKNKKWQIRAHRAVWISVYGIPKEGMVVDHINNDKSDNRISNLQLLTQKDNSTKASKDGLYLCGNDNPATKIPVEMRSVIFWEYVAGGITYQQLAEKYGISKSRIAQIVQNKGYTDVPFRGKPAPDSARYKALGNSMCVNVMAWIGKRIQAVEDGTI